MNILLVNPPRSPHNAILDYAPEQARRFVHRKLIGPPLGLLTIGATIRNHNVTLLEMKGENDLVPDAPQLQELVTQYLRQTKPQVVGVTFIASEFPAGIEIFRVVKSCDPEILTIAGGLHATLCPHDFNDPSVDIVCTESAVHTFPRIINALESGCSFDDIGGILLKKDSRLTATGAAVPPCDPVGKDFVMPERSYLKRWLSTYVVGRATGPSTYVFTSLGCPYRCSFCSIWPQYRGQYLQRDVESVIEELKTLDDYEVVRFADGNTLVDLDFAKKLFDRIEEEDIRKTFIMDVRFDTAAKQPKLIEKLARGGLKVVIVGFESFRQKELERYNKQTTAKLIGEAIRVFHDNGIMLRGNYIVPPDYTEEDFDALTDYAEANPVAFAGYTILTPMPGTRFYKTVRDQIIDHDLSKYNFFNCVMKTRLPLERFYERVGALWLIRKGTETI